MSNQVLICFCGSEYVARDADIVRGWAKTCSKSCAATKRSYSRPNATYPDGSKVKWGVKIKRARKPASTRLTEDYDDDPSWDAHKSC